MTVISKLIFISEYGEIFIHRACYRNFFRFLSAKSVDEDYAKLLNLPKIRSVGIEYSPNEGASKIWAVTYEGKLIVYCQEYPDGIEIAVDVQVKEVFITNEGVYILDNDKTLWSVEMNSNNTRILENIQSVELINDHTPRLSAVTEDHTYYDDVTLNQIQFPGVKFFSQGIIIDDHNLRVARINLSISLPRIDHQIVDMIMDNLTSRVFILDDKNWIRISRILRGFVDRVSVGIVELPFKPTRLLTITHCATARSVSLPLAEDEQGNLYILPELNKLNLPAKLFNEANLNIGRMTKPANK